MTTADRCKCGALPRTDSREYDLRQRLNRAVRWLREAEDIARMEMPAWPTADRIRSIYEQVTEDVLNGTTTVPPMRQRLTDAIADRDRYRAVLEEVDAHYSGSLDHQPAYVRNVRAALA